MKATPKKAPAKKPWRKKKMPLRTRILVTGFITAFVVQAVGWPVASRMGWKASETQQYCDAQIREKAEAIAKGPQATGDTIADATLGRAAAFNTPQCQAASAAVRASTRVVYWVSHIVVVVVLLSAVPWLYFIVTWTVEYRRSLPGKPRS
jgi:hypothetical protein